MIKYKTSERKVDLYDIGDGLTLMNVILKNEDGKMRSIDTYIGTDRNGFSCVGHTEGLDEPGVIFSYPEHLFFPICHTVKWFIFWQVQNLRRSALALNEFAGCGNERKQ